MNEKILINGKLSNIKLISLIILVIGLFLGFVCFYIMLCNDKNYFEKRMCDSRYFSESLCEKYTNMSNIQYLKEREQNSYWICGISISSGFLILSLIFYCCFFKEQIVVTNKRIYGTVLFGNLISIPLNSFIAVETNWLNGLSIFTVTGKIKFKFIKNNKIIYKEINELLSNI